MSDVASAIAYNKRSMRRYDWDRGDIGLHRGASDCAVVTKVKSLQRGWGVVEDGKVGPVTIRRIRANKVADISDSHPDSAKQPGPASRGGQIMVGGKIVETDFPSVPCKRGSKYSLMEEGDYSKRRVTTDLVVWHWDASLSADSCHRILAARDVSSHGCIDNDGTFYQFLDFHDVAAWHAGHRKTNARSIGIDVSNAVYTKYQKWYTKRFGPRPVLSGVVVNGHKYPDFLGYYQAQLDTAKGLAAFIEGVMGIPRNTPAEANKLANLNSFKGHIAHYHVTKRKWDVAGFDFDYVMGKKG